MPQFATMTLADGAVNQVPALCTFAGSGSAAGRYDGYHDGNRAAGVMEPRRHHTAQSLIGRQQRAIARNLAVQLQRPTWHLCWKSIAARSREDTALSAGASPPSYWSAQDR